MPLGFIGMLGSLIAVEYFVASHALQFTGDQALLDWRTTGQAVSGEEVRRSEVLCFGDSLVKHGLFPRILEVSLGRPIFNLALPAGQAPASYFLLRRALEAGAKPKALVVDFHSMPLLFPPRMSAAYWPELLTARELVELSLVARDPRLFTLTALAKALPSVKDRHAIRAELLASLRGQVRPGTELYPVYLHNWRVNRGTVVSPPRRSPASVVECAAKADNAVRAPGTARWVAHWVNTLYIRRFLDLAAARGIAVFWLLPPTSPAFQARSEHNGVDAWCAAFVRETQACYTNVVVIDGRRAGYRPEVFLDLTHLDGRGASTLSQAVASLIGPYLADIEPAPTTRWIALTPYRVRPEEIPLEDLDQSRMALRASGDRFLR
jgi:hypothetical protein